MTVLKHWLIGIGVTYGVVKLLAICISILLALGDIYWLWTAIQIESFWMFICGLVPPFVAITGPVGAWSLLFGVPAWVYNVFS